MVQTADSRDRNVSAPQAGTKRPVPAKARAVLDRPRRCRAGAPPTRTRSRCGAGADAPKSSRSSRWNRTSRSSARSACSPAAAASTRSRFAASTASPIPAAASIIASTASAPASTSRACWRPCASATRRSIRDAMAHGPARIEVFFDRRDGAPALIRPAGLRRNTAASRWLCADSSKPTARWRAIPARCRRSPRPGMSRPPRSAAWFACRAISRPGSSGCAASARASKRARLSSPRSRPARRASTCCAIRCCRTSAKACCISRSASARCSPTRWASARPCRRSRPASCWRGARISPACWWSARPRSRRNGRSRSHASPIARRVRCSGRGRRASPPIASRSSSPSSITSRCSATPRTSTRSCAPDIVVLDEAQRIKNWQTKTARRVKSLRSPYAFVLTGTPVENRIDELYSIVQYLDPELLGPLFRFNRDFYELDERGRPVDYKNLAELRRRLAHGDASPPQGRRRGRAARPHGEDLFRADGRGAAGPLRGLPSAGRPAHRASRSAAAARRRNSTACRCCSPACA